MIDIPKTYRTRGGQEVRGLHIEEGAYPLVGERLDKDGRWAYTTWTMEGHYTDAAPDSHLNLVEAAPQDTPCLPGWRWVRAGENLKEGDWRVDPLAPVGARNCMATLDHTFIRQIKPIDLTTCTFGQRLRISDGSEAIYLRLYSENRHTIAIPGDIFLAEDGGQVPGTGLYVEEVL